MEEGFEEGKDENFIFRRELGFLRVTLAAMLRKTWTGLAIQQTVWETIADMQARHDGGLDQDSYSEPGA